MRPAHRALHSVTSCKVPSPGWRHRKRAGRLALPESTRCLRSSRSPKSMARSRGSRSSPASSRRAIPPSAPARWEMPSGCRRRRLNTPFDGNRLGCRTDRRSHWEWTPESACPIRRSALRAGRGPARRCVPPFPRRSSGADARHSQPHPAVAPRPPSRYPCRCCSTARS